MSEPRRRGFLGLGSNEGDRLENLRAARDLLDGPLTPAVRVIAASGVYETEPQGGASGQDDFLNACLEIETTLEPDALLDACKAVERRLGREPGGPRHGPRPIDVDLLLLGELELSTERLTLPHPEVTRRRFVVVPLLELDPGLALPSGAALADLAADVEGQRVERAGELLSAAPPRSRSE